jgi:hypothetical protein
MKVYYSNAAQDNFFGGVWDVSACTSACFFFCCRAFIEIYSGH